jgi:hypothetical protein
MSDLTSITIGPVYLSFPHLFVAAKAKGSDKALYSVTALWDKKTKEGKKITAQVDAAIEAAEEEGASKLEKTPLKKQKRPKKDGDEERPDDPNYAGRFMLVCNNGSQPDVVDKKLQPILDAEDVYPGCIAFIQVNFRAYNNVGVGVGCYVQNVMIVCNDEKKAPRWAMSKIDPSEAFKGVKFEDDDDEDDDLPPAKSKKKVVDDDDFDDLPPKKKSKYE